MTEAELIRWLRDLRFTPRRQRQGGRSLTIQTVAAEAHVHRNTIYSIIAGKPARWETLERIDEVAERMIKRPWCQTLRSQPSASAGTISQAQHFPPKT